MIRILSALIAVTAVSFFNAGEVLAQNKAPEPVNKLANWIQWMPDESLGFPIEIAKKTWMENHPTSNDLYIFLQATSFTKENVERIVTEVPRRYPFHSSIHVTIYSSKEKLLRVMENTTIGLVVLPPDPEARGKAEAYRISMNRGFFRAFYHYSYVGERYFSYSPDPEKEQLVKVTLPPKTY